MQLDLVEIIGFTRLYQNIPFLCLLDAPGLVLQYIIVYLYSEASSKQLCCVLLDLSRQYFPVRLCLIINKHKCDRMM